MQLVRENDQEPDIVMLAWPGRDDEYAAIIDGFQRPNRPDGLFCFNDETAIRANKAIHDLGLAVPNDVAIVGSDGIIDETRFSIPSLSTIAQPFDEMCSLA
jgi:LacI family transcriptional regulator